MKIKTWLLLITLVLSACAPKEKVWRMSDSPAAHDCKPGFACAARETDPIGQSPVKHLPRPWNTPGMQP